ncbi:MAG: type II toxin-antitoxin system HicB family antitoxin [Armatimonadetes bacterium]|nr:type II toxin-antitoxin system HicB family antitoxin [Armatimonadota bacterium]
MKHELIMWWSEEDQEFLAEVPELPVCIADGKSREECLRNLDEAAALWVAAAKKHGREVPEPKGRLRYA